MSNLRDVVGGRVDGLLVVATAGGLLDLVTTAAILTRDPGDELNLVLRAIAGQNIPFALGLFGAFVALLVVVAAVETPWLSRVATLYLFVTGLSGLNNVLFLTLDYSPLYATMGEATSPAIAYGIPVGVLLAGTGWTVLAEAEPRWRRIALVSAVLLGAIVALPALAT